MNKKTQCSLSQDQLVDFVTNGYVVLRPNFTTELNHKIVQQADRVFESCGNPQNDVLNKVPLLSTVISDPQVSGALTTVVGVDNVLHPHRHCHRNSELRDNIPIHQDSYPGDENVRHHRLRWVLLFYYPEKVTSKNGPTAIIPGSHYYNTPESIRRIQEVKLCVEAGTVVIANYNLWHRATINRLSKPRYMMKFVFCRMSEPKELNFNTEETWKGTQTPDVIPAMSEELFYWMSGKEAEIRRGKELNRQMYNNISKSPGSKEVDVIYNFSKSGISALPLILDCFIEEAVSKAKINLSKKHTNPSQLTTSYALTRIGHVEPLIDLLGHPKWEVRAAAASVIGDIGKPHQGVVDALVGKLDDENMWVRRNSLEAIGIIGQEDDSIIHKITSVLQTDDVEFVKLNAMIALSKFGCQSKIIHDAIQNCITNHSSYYLREWGHIALERCYGIMKKYRP